MQVKGFYNQLIDEKTPIGDRYKAIFELKNLQTQETIGLMLKSFDSLGDSQLLKHELVYTLGQVSEKFYPQIKQFLFDKVNDELQPKLVRHEAAEAIANYFDPDSIPLYQKHVNSPVQYLAMTCQIALYKVTNDVNNKQLYGQQYAGTRQPIAAFSQQEFQKLLADKQLLEEYWNKGMLSILCNQKVSLVQRYKILYLMRNIDDEECKFILCKILSKQYFKTQPALFKHEICFALGQIGLGNDQNEKLLRECIENEEEEDIVRHQALAAVATQSKDQQYLQTFVNHPIQIIRQSAQVAIYEIKYWHD